MEYNKIFDPNKVVSDEPYLNKNFGDRCSKSVYVYDENIILAVNISIATGRPLLVRGPSGWGKSSLAKNVAKVLGWRYYEKVISSRTQARDLLWDVDMLLRLQDAQIGHLKDISFYIRPGVLWKAFDHNSALTQEKKALSLSSGGLSTSEEQEGISDYSHAVVLLDEIDKADPDFPNNLLVPLGSLYFTVDETGTEVKCEKPPLVIITTNDERDLPPAFLRRCVELQLSLPNLLEVGKAHFGEEHIDLVKEIARLFNNTEIEQIDSSTIRSSAPSPAEFIDAVNVCMNLKIEDPKSDIWNMIKKAIVWKHGRKERG